MDFGFSDDPTAWLNTHYDRAKKTIYVFDEIYRCELLNEQLADILINEKKVGSYCGGTCNETNISAQTTTNIAIACMADQCLAKPGMGVDEGYMIVRNEMNRVLAIANSRNK